MVNMGCIDMNAWTSRVDRADRPDWVIFDLDPSDDVGFAEVIEVAVLVKQTLDLVELESFPKTSGSRGIHVLVPIARRHGFDETRTFASIIAGALARAHPALVTTEWAKRKRRGVLVDANQNGAGQDDGLCLLRAPAGRCARFGAARVGRGAAGARSRRVHLRCRPRARRKARRPVRARAHAASVARGGASLAGLTAPKSSSAGSRPTISTGDRQGSSRRVRAERRGAPRGDPGG